MVLLRWVKATANHFKSDFTLSRSSKLVFLCSHLATLLCLLTCQTANKLKPLSPNMPTPSTKKDHCTPKCMNCRLCAFARHTVSIVTKNFLLGLQTGHRVSSRNFMWLCHYTKRRIRSAVANDPIVSVNLSLEGETCKIAFSKEYNPFSHALSCREVSRRFPRKRMGKPSGCFLVGNALAKRIIARAQKNFASWDLGEDMALQHDITSPSFKLVA